MVGLVAFSPVRRPLRQVSSPPPPSFQHRPREHPGPPPMIGDGGWGIMSRPPTLGDLPRLLTSILAIVAGEEEACGLGVAAEGGGVEDGEQVLGLHSLDVLERAAEVRG